MKSKDIAVIGIVVIISIVLSVVVSKSLIVPAKNRQQKVEVVPQISTSFPAPSSSYFNTNSIDPTQLITIGNNNNGNPFSGSTAP